MPDRPRAKTLGSKTKARGHVDLGRCPTCRTPLLPACPNCKTIYERFVDPDEPARAAERADIMALVEREIRSNPPFDNTVPALRRVLAAIQKRGSR
jgi:hypothetical protein